MDDLILIFIEQDHSRTIKTRILSKKHFSGESESASCAIRRRERGRAERRRLPFRTRLSRYFCLRPMRLCMESGSSLWKSSHFEFNYRCVRAARLQKATITDVIIILDFLLFSQSVLPINHIEMISIRALEWSRKNFYI